MLTIRVEWGRPRGAPQATEYPSIQKAVQTFAPAAYTWVRLNEHGLWVAYLSTTEGDREAAADSIGEALRELERMTHEWLLELGLYA